MPQRSLVYFSPGSNKDLDLVRGFSDQGGLRFQCMEDVESIHALMNRSFPACLVLDATERPEPGSQGGVGLYYRALVAIDPVPAGDGLDPRRLASGMQLAAEIHLGTRTVFEYLLSPVRRTLSEAGRES